MRERSNSTSRTVGTKTILCVPCVARVRERPSCSFLVPAKPPVVQSTKTTMEGSYNAGTKSALVSLSALFYRARVSLWRATDCLEDMSNSAIVHNGIFGYGDEKQNMLAEKAFEDAQARGFRPCAFFSLLLPPLCWLSVSDCAGPVCKKMNDIRPNSIFLSSAFEPSPEELRMFARTERERSRLLREKKPAKQERKPTPPKPKPAVRVKPEPEIVELSSDEELPDFSQILAGTKQEGTSYDVSPSEGLTRPGSESEGFPY